MDRIIIDENLKGEHLVKFLHANKSALITQKKSAEKWCDAITFNPISFEEKTKLAFKSDAPDAGSAAESGVLRVKVVANTSMYMDSASDVLLRDSASKSMKERKGLIPHLKNHGRTLDDEVGKVRKIYYEEISLKDLGWNKSGTAQALVFETDILKAYDESTFTKYLNGRINQHSIGLKYVQLDLAIYDEDDNKEMEFWNKYIDDIINKDDAISQGYFWVVPEYKLIENSAVLFGANILTPTLSTSGKSNHNQPGDEPTDDDPLKSDIDVLAEIRKLNFFNN